MATLRNDRPFSAEWLLLLSSIIIFSGFLAYTYRSQSSDIELRERERLAGQAKVIHDGIARQLSGVNRALVSARDELPLWNTPGVRHEIVSRRLKAFVEAMPGVRTMTLLDARGTILAASRQELIGENFSSRMYFQAVVKKPDLDTLYVSPPFKTSLGVWAMNVVRMVPGRDGGFDGIVSATIDPDEFKAILASVRYSPEMWTAIAHGDGLQFVMEPDRPEQAGKNLDQPGSFFTRHRESGLTSEVLVGTAYATGERRMMALHTIQPAELHMDKPLVVAVGRDIDTLYKGLNQQAGQQAGLLFALAVSAIFSLAYSQRKRRHTESELELAAHALAEREQLYRQLFQVNAAIKLVIDAQTGQIVDANNAATEYYGYPHDQLLGMKISQINCLPPEEVAAEMLRAQQEERLYFNFRHRLASGEIRDVEVYSGPARIHGRDVLYSIVHDITEKKRYADALTEFSRDVEAFLDQTTDFIYFKDINSRFRFCSQTLANITGHRSWRDMIGKHDLEVFPPDTAQIYYEEELPILAAGTPLLNKIDPYYDVAGRRCFVQTSKWPLFDKEGKVAGIFGISRDITQMMEVENELRQAKTDAEAASKAKSEFVANMSHEIRTPMNAVLGFLQLLEHTELSTSQLDYVQKAHSAGKSLLAILNDILDFSKVEAGKLELEIAAFRLDDLLRELSVVLSAALNTKEVEVLLEVDPAVPHALRGDALRLQQVLLNLCGNAIKFTERGEVVLSVKQIAIGETHADIEFSVRDTGIGIPQDRLKAIFEGFTQAEASTTRRYGGTGLGLAISQRLVRLMGGELWAESVPGSGSAFHFTISLERDVTAPAVLQRPPWVAARQDMPASLRVLIADDNAAARDVLTNMALSFGWQAHTVCSGIEAIECLQRESAAGHPFDVLCIDWVMPGMDGWETVQHVRNLSFKSTPPAVLMVTAHGRELVMERINVEGSAILDGFIVKPFSPSMLFDAVAQVTHGESVAIEHRAVPRINTHPLAGIRVLLVEDNPLNQHVAQQMLTHAGAYVQVAPDGRHGIEAVKLARPAFDIVLMDIQMPEMDGYEATRALRAAGITIPIVAMTANVLPSDREASLAAGMNDHIGKPFDMGHLVRSLRRLCGYPDPRTAPGPLSPPTDAMPVLPEGFDLAAALSRVEGNRRLFAEVVRRFLSDHRSMLHEAEQALQQGDRAAAARNLHTLKGLAATLGAMALSAAAAAVEAKCKIATDVAEMDLLLQGLKLKLDEALRVLAGVADSFAPPASPVSRAMPDTTRRNALLAELDELLATRNMRAVDLFATLKEEFGPESGESLAALDEAILRFDFASAREKLANLATLFKS